MVRPGACFVVKPPSSGGGPSWDSSDPKQPQRPDVQHLHRLPQQRCQQLRQQQDGDLLRKYRQSSTRITSSLQMAGWCVGGPDAPHAFGHARGQRCSLASPCDLPNLYEDVDYFAYFVV